MFLRDLRTYQPQIGPAGGVAIFGNNKLKGLDQLLIQLNVFLSGIILFRDDVPDYIFDILRIIGPAGRQFKFIK